MTERPNPKKRRAVRRWITRGVLALMLVAAGLAVYSSTRPKPQKVDLAEVGRDRLEVTLADDGRTRVRARYTVSAPLHGRVLRMGLAVGDTIKEGQVVATFVPQTTPLLDGRTLAEAEARAHASAAEVKRAGSAVEGAKTALELAKSEAQRARALFDEGAIPKADLDRALSQERLRTSDLATAEFGAQVARHDEALARVVLGRAKPGEGKAGEAAAAESITVTAPASGRVLKLLQESEGVVAPGAPLVEIGDPQNLEIVVDVLTSEAVKVKPGQAATVTRWGGETLHAHVRMVEPSATTKLSALGVEEQRVNVVLDLDEARDRWAALGDGYRVEVAIVIDAYDGATLVPIGALFRKEGQSHVFAMDAGGVVREREVVIVAQGALSAAVSSGVEPGEKVVLHPSDRIKEGTLVEAR